MSSLNFLVANKQVKLIASPSTCSGGASWRNEEPVVNFGKRYVFTLAIWLTLISSSIFFHVPMNYVVFINQLQVCLRKFLVSAILHM